MQQSQAVVGRGTMIFGLSHALRIGRNNFILGERRSVLQFNLRLLSLGLGLRNLFVGPQNGNAKQQLTGLHSLPLAHINILQNAILLRTHIDVAQRNNVTHIRLRQRDIVY